MSEQRAREFLATRKTLVMATMGADGTPTVSYAPFVQCGSGFYVYTSMLSRHTRDLLETERASVMFIEDEVNSGNIFARKRLTFPCRAAVIPLQHIAREEVMDLFANKFGATFALIRPLGDFVLFQLDPTEGTYVEGFARAYRIDAALLHTTHIGGGHTPRRAKDSPTKTKKPRE